MLSLGVALEGWAALVLTALVCWEKWGLLLPSSGRKINNSHESNPGKGSTAQLNWAGNSWLGWFYGIPQIWGAAQVQFQSLDPNATFSVKYSLNAAAFYRFLVRIWTGNKQGKAACGSIIHQDSVSIEGVLVGFGVGCFVGLEGFFQCSHWSFILL